MINVDITDILYILYIFQGICVAFGIFSIAGFLRYKKAYFTIFLLIGFIGFFIVNDWFNENREKRILQGLNKAGFSVTELTLITIAKDNSIEVTYKNHSNQSYKFNVVGEYWKTKIIKLQPQSASNHCKI